MRTLVHAGRMPGPQRAHCAWRCRAAAREVVRCQAHARNAMAAAAAAGLLLASGGADAAAVAAALLDGGAAPSPPRHALVLLDGNAAILSDLRRLSKATQRFGSQEAVTGGLAARFAAAAEQLGRIELLARAGEYDNARLQLREGSFKSLRQDLAYGQELTRVVSPAVVREVVEGIERLDRQLKTREAPGAVRPVVAALEARLGELSEVVGSLQK
ncbi:hypothetical protein HT031_003436 [Scenedesmus sp. PABB004]|nr:hypothetical protein HT031_003436 [Scenedesmus sp. PABB004]